ERAISIQLTSIVQHPEFRRLERVWKGLELLASRTPKTGVRLEVLSCEAATYPAGLARSIEAGRGTEPPVSCALVDHTVDGSAASFGVFRQLAELGQNHTVPVLMNAGAGLFRHEDLTQVDRLDNKAALFESPEAITWRSEVNRPAALWTALSLNRVLSRLPYDRRTSRIREAEVVELHDEADPEAALFISAAWVVGSLITRSFERHQWPCGITGARNGGVAENLPVRQVDTPGASERVAVPTEVFFSTDTQKQLSRLGLIALASQPNDDSTYLLTAPTAYVPPPKRTYEGASTEPEVRFPATPLVDQLFVARLIQFIQALNERIAPTEAPADIQAFLEAALWELFSDAKPGRLELSVDVQATEGGATASFQIRPHRFLGVQMEELAFDIPIGG
ncbi:MAG: type VI secretion system contractile sheath large subunit, partial [Myxococcota bacterium]